MFLARDANATSSYSTQDHGPSIVEASWILMGIATIVMAARFYVRARLVKRISIDDWLMLFSYILTIIATICFTISVHFGLGKHEELLTPAGSVEAVKWNFIGQIIGIVSATCSRLSFCMMLFVVTSVTKQTRQQRISRILLWSVALVQLLVNVGLVIFLLTQCDPLKKLWDRTVSGTCLPLDNQEHFAFVQGSVNSATDLALAIFPATIIWNLKLKLAIKISLIITMGLGFFTMIAAIVKTVHLNSIAHLTDFSYETSYLIIWFSLEMWFLIITASIPTLRPLLCRTSRSSYGSKTISGTIIPGSKAAAAWNRSRNFTNMQSEFKELTNSPITSPNIQGDYYYGRYEPPMAERTERIAVGMDDGSPAGIRRPVFLEVSV
ncbi:uncharacterized protein LY89DRAFT_758503 [Mollisia scopiformis]|uniref:Rhodopsin domain-containing protein n=1 Tax=Mollisia scopiformis TaxID=149040 RepID=A0A194WUS5_MOLSC|nr:uncharacterized protein LY89DRAFT_758503 [Mollisia scopiformis]KUJ11716.1 hypothetical protein LY89DRAFT_758503 [Mollisia scopiformis]